MKMFWQKLFAFKFTWLKKAADAAEDAWNSLTSIEQIIGKTASGIFAIINANLKALPSVVWSIVQSYYPNVTLDLFLGYMNKVASYLNIANGIAVMSLSSVIELFQNWLSTVTGNAWIAKTQSAVSFLISVIASPETLIQKITSVLEYCYNTFIKGVVVPA